MDKTERPRLAAVFDPATLKGISSIFEALPPCVEKLKSQDVATLDEAAACLCAEMERESSRARSLILHQPPKQLLGYVWSWHHMNVLGEMDEQGDGYRPDKGAADTTQFLLEFVHAVWSCSPELADERGNLNEADVAEIFDALEKLRNTMMLYCLMISKGMAVEAGDLRRGRLSMGAMAAWTNLRGRRYQILEEEFMRFMLRPHDEALRKCYDMGADEIAASVQAVPEAIRTGFADACDRIERGMEAAHPHDGVEGIDPDVLIEVKEAMDDLSNGGICNLSRHTNLTRPLLEDISYSPGENTEFMAEGKLRGTPLRTFPALVKPGIRLGDDYYITDGQFVRDVAFRCIQRGLLGRDPGYREEWNRRQKRLVEDAFTKIFGSQLKGAAAYHSVFFPEPKTGDWVETDLVVVVDDALLVVEAKAGGMAMRSPAEDFDKHMASVERLIVKAHKQCKRLLEYLASAASVPLYAHRRGKYVKVGDLSLGKFRKILPIGLTVESLSPFSTGLHNPEAIAPLLGKHGFMSMSVDELLVLRRFLSTAGELFHYLEVRQQACSVSDAIFFDEMEYLGAYVSRNRFDMDLRAQRAEAEFVMWNSFADVVDQHFQGENVGCGDVPQQSYPAELAAVLSVLDRKRPRGWLAIDAAIRNHSSEERNNLSKSLAGLKTTLESHDYRWMLFFFNEMPPFQVWVCASGQSPQQKAVRRRAEVACLCAAASNTHVLLLWYNKKRRLTNATCRSYATPHKGRSDYMELEQQAAAQRARLIDTQDVSTRVFVGASAPSHK